MKEFNTIATENNGPVTTLWLARPDVHNALNNLMIREISSFFTQIEKKNEARVVVIRGKGKSFCSGADMVCMRKAFSLTEAENLKESEELSNMFKLIYNCSKMVIAQVHGNIFGGGNGLVAACDLAYCVSNSTFSLSEARIGMAAATITPYLLKKMRASDLKALIFSARKFNGDEAVKYGLVNQAFASENEMASYLEEFIAQIIANGKIALVESKKLINQLMEQQMANDGEPIPHLLARIRVSPEAQEGFAAFLEKRKPKW